jgi:hypothetical protein
MAKQQHVPDDILKKFNKPQYKIGDPVYIIWLGMKKFGYVTAFKTVNWGIQYTVEADNHRYPCGISIKGQKTSYNTGCIMHDDTRSIGEQDIIKRIQTGDYRTNTEVFRDTRRSTNESGSGDIVSERISTPDNTGTKPTRARSKTKDAVKPVASGVRGNIAKERGDSKLDNAIQKQRDFLNGFVKKD